jgi:hypothetical protein
MRILILGGYGIFGGRLARLLCDETRVTLLIAGRSLQQATDFCTALPGIAPRVPVAFDRNGDVEMQLRAWAPNLVVDASGPFQAYGDNPFRVVTAAIACGVDYMDLADGSDFVHGIAVFDEEARMRGLVVLSGVSSFPVLTAAVVRRLAQGMARVETITAGIAPSPYAGVGRNVIRAIASYAGQKTKLLRDGVPATGYALTESFRFTIAPPGKLPLRHIHFSLVDVPDLQVLPPLWPGLRSIWMGAGPVPEVLHRMLNALAWLVRLRILRSLAPLAWLFYRSMNILRWGEHRGGMFVAVRGVDARGAAMERSWHLLAEGDDGPFIPSMAVEALVRRSLDGQRPAIGARPATHDLEVEDYEKLFARRTIYTGTRDQETGPLYRRILGSAWHALPQEIRAMHELSGTMTASGVAGVERGGGMLARLAASLFRLPRGGENVPVRVIFTARDGVEIWQRNFAGRRFESVQSEGQGRSSRLIEERFGPVRVALAVVLEDGGLRLIVRRWALFGVPMPMWLAPHGEAREFVREGRFNFDVEIRQRLIGRVVRYRGWLELLASA